MSYKNAIIWGPLVAAILVSVGCGSIGVRDPKPAKITVECVDIEQDKNGRLVVSRNGERFKPCGDNCNVYTGQVKVDSITTKNLGGGRSSAVTLVGYQWPMVDYDEEEDGKTSIQIEKTTSPSTIRKSVGTSTKVNLSSNQSSTAKEEKVTLFALQHKPKKPCLLVESIEEPNFCCSFFYAKDANGSGQILPRKEDPDCAAHF